MMSHEKHLEDTIPYRLQVLAKTEPHTAAYVFVEEGSRTVLSRQEVYTLSTKMAARLRRYGIRTGDLVANTLENSPEALVLEFGILMCGGISHHPMRNLHDGEDVIRTLKGLGTKAVVMRLNTAGTDFLKLIAAKVQDTHYGFDMQSRELPELTTCIVFHEDRDVLEELSHQTDALCEMPCPTDLAIIRESSGTTAARKQIPLNHGNILKIGSNGASGMPHEKEYNIMFNDSAFYYSVGYPSYYPSHGITRVLRDRNKASSLPSWNIICQEKCVQAFLPPKDILQMMDAERSCTDWKLKRIITGFYPVKKSIMSCISKLTDSVSVLYGITEIQRISMLSVGPHDSYEDHCVGFPFPGSKVMVVDDQEKEVPPGRSGFILAKTPSMFSGYLLNGSAGRDAFTEDGWYRTDDVGHIDKEGRLFLNGRGSDAINRSSDVLYPYWLEQKILECPEVKDVALVPVPDPVFHQEICVCLLKQDIQQNELSGHPVADGEGSGTLVADGEGSAALVAGSAPLEQKATESTTETLESNYILRIKQFVENHVYGEKMIPLKYYLVFKQFQRDVHGKLNRKAMTRSAAFRLNLL